MEMFLPLVLGIVLVTLFTMLVLRFAVKLGLVVRPDSRRLHRKSTPHLGGIAFFLTFAVGAILFTQSSAGEGQNTVLLALLVGAPLAFLIGLWDDLTAIGSKRKLFSQGENGSLRT